MTFSLLKATVAYSLPLVACVTKGTRQYARRIHQRVRPTASVVKEKGEGIPCVTPPLLHTFEHQLLPSQNGQAADARSANMRATKPVSKSPRMKSG
jgi:hypothetical protein